MKLRAAAAVLIVYSTLLIQKAMPDLPERIPTSFNIHGQPTSVSRPETLWLLLAGEALIVGLLLAIPYLARYAPQWVSLGKDRLSGFSPVGQGRVIGLLESATGWMAVAFGLFFSNLIRQMIAAAMDSASRPSLWMVPVFVIAFLGVFVYFAWRYTQLDKEAPPFSTSRPVRPLSPPLSRTPSARK